MAEVLTVAVCLFNNVTALDYQGPVELFGFLSPESVKRYSLQTSHALRLTFLAHSLEPVTPGSGPSVIPQGTFDYAIISNTQYDILLVPGGAGARPESVPADLLRFLKHQIPGARYVLGVCTGSWILAGTGILDSKRATTNKSSFNACKKATSDKIEWVAKARWVVDGRALASQQLITNEGMDMASAFIVHLVGEDVAKVVRGSVELSVRGEDEDEFAAIHGLVGADS